MYLGQGGFPLGSSLEMLSLSLILLKFLYSAFLGFKYFLFLSKLGLIW